MSRNQPPDAPYLCGAAGVADVGRAPFMSSSDDVPMCRPTDSTERLAVLGVIGVESQGEVRDSIRRTWLPGGAAADMLAYFVLRGVGILPQTRAEARRHDDIVFLRAAATQSRHVGPLWSQWLWLVVRVVMGME